MMSVKKLRYLCAKKQDLLWKEVVKQCLVVTILAFRMEVIPWV